MTQSSAPVRIWDIWVRTFHWALATSVLFLLVSGETGFQFFEWHRQVGEFVLLLLLFRLLWGLIGSSNARLKTLASDPRKAVTHLRQLMKGNVLQERGHNAAGAWAVLVILLLLAFQAISGMFIADEDELIEGVFYGAFSSSQSEQLLQLHHTNAQLLMILAGLHVFMVLFYLIRAGQNLIIPMISGLISWHGKPPPVNFASNWLGFGLFVASAAILGYWLGWYRF